MVRHVSSNESSAQNDDASRLAALLRPYLYPTNRGRSALPGKRLAALSGGFIQ